MMISCIVTAYQEPRTVGQAIQALLDQAWTEDYEILVVCPDEQTTAVAWTYVEKDAHVRQVKDAGSGKPAALNLAFTQVQGDICVLTDGDVEVQPGTINSLLAPFHDPKCGAVTGRPISASPRSTMLGFWSHLLTDAGAHRTRTHLAQQHRYFDCSGYLYAVRRCLLSALPEEALADDAYISQVVWQQGYRIAYAPQAQVAVRYPTTYRDWLLQKVRSTTGATTTSALLPSDPLEKAGTVREAKHMRSFARELAEGLLPTLLYPRSLREWWWTLCLLAARLHLWIRVWLERHVAQRSHREIWKRVESTK